VSQGATDGEGNPQAVGAGSTGSELQATGDTVGGRHLPLLALALRKFVAFDEALQRLPGLVEELEIPEDRGQPPSSRKRGALSTLSGCSTAKVGRRIC
jgi:hypothetical protein